MHLIYIFLILYITSEAKYYIGGIVYETNRIVLPNDICYMISDLYSIPPEQLIALSLYSESPPTQDTSDHFIDNVENFLDYLEKEENKKKLHFLSAKEKELLFYYNHLPPNDQTEIVEIMKLKLQL